MIVTGGSKPSSSKAGASAIKKAISHAAQQEDKARAQNEKQKERERAADAKPTRKIIATSVKRKEREEAKRAQDETQRPLAAQHVVDIDGNEILLPKALKSIINFLQKREHHAEASLDEVQQATNIDLTLSANAKLLENLQENPKVEPLEGVGMAMRLRYLPPYGIRNKAALAHVMQKTLVDGVALGNGRPSTFGIPRAELKSSDVYSGIEDDLDEFLSARRCVELQRTDNKEKVVFAAPMAESASLAVRRLWDEVRVPKGDDLQAELLACRVRTPEQLEDRRQRKVLAQQRRNAALSKKKQRKAIAPRKITNTHLDRAKLLGQPAS